jgi:hypothetical protein
MPHGFPVFEFFSFVREKTLDLERLELPDKFVKAIAGQESDHASPREISAGQKTCR